MGGDYQVTEAINAEREAVKRVTTEINALQAKRTADVAEIRRWRMSYRAWKNNVKIINRQAKKDEENAQRITKKIEAYNDSISRIARVQNLGIDDNISRYQELLAEIQAELDALRNEGIEEDALAPLQRTQGLLDDGQIQATNLIRAKRRYEEQMDKYQDYLVVKQQHDEQKRKYDDYLVLQKEYEREKSMFQDRKQVIHQNWLKKHHEWESWQQETKNVEKRLDALQQQLQLVNDNEYGVEVVELDYNTGALKIDSEVIPAISNQILFNYSGAVDAFNEASGSRLWQITGLPDFSNAEGAMEDGNQADALRLLNNAIYQRISEWVSEMSNQIPTREEFEMLNETFPEPIEEEIEVPKEPDKVKKPTELEKVSEPVEPESLKMPKFDTYISYQPPKTNEIQVDWHLIEQLNQFASGKYENTQGKANEINALAQNIGENCPQIEIADTSFNRSGLISALDEVEASWQLFGMQRNSAQGVAVVNKFKSTIAELRDVQNYGSLKSVAIKFSENSTQLFIWLSSNWWQLGGNPDGNAHPWKGTHARKLVKPKK